MAASAAFNNALASAGAGLITHIGLVDATGTELSGGGYARIAITPTAAINTIRFGTDRTFSVPAGATVAGWRAYNGAAGGATNYGGGDLTAEEYTSAGQYILEGATTGFTINAA